MEFPFQNSIACTNPVFILFMNSIQHVIEPRVKAAIYADDLAIIATESEIGTAQVRLQSCLNRLEKWSEDWAMTINTTKTTYTVFSLSPKHQNIKLNMNKTPLRKEENPCYLGTNKWIKSRRKEYDELLS